jgi:2-oxoisovalerate dehydrogenase E1 component alpha subunit
MKRAGRPLAKAKVSAGVKTKRTKIQAGGSRPVVSEATQIRMLDLMIKSRVLEERLIKVYRKGGAFFWIGGPGEEAFGVALGLLAKKGQGPAFDYLHLHYRCTPTLVAMGLEMVDSLRLIMNRSTDPSTGGRNFSNHFCFPKWNILPVTSPIEVQYGFAVGTAIAQRRRRMAGEDTGVTIVSGGDAGTAEGDFASSLIWSSRPGQELPLYITVQNNKWGISTGYDSQHGEKNIADRGWAFGMKTSVVDGNDPVESYLAIERDLRYIRETGRPVLTEFMVSRLYGHSSASGANRANEVCCIEAFTKRLVDQKTLSSSDVAAIWKSYEAESERAADQAASEPVPGPDSIWDHTYVNNENADWRKF